MKIDMHTQTGIGWRNQNVEGNEYQISEVVRLEILPRKVENVIDFKFQERSGAVNQPEVLHVDKSSSDIPPAFHSGEKEEVVFHLQRPLVERSSSGVASRGTRCRSDSCSQLPFLRS